MRTQTGTKQMGQRTLARWKAQSDQYQQIEHAQWQWNGHPARAAGLDRVTGQVHFTAWWSSSTGAAHARVLVSLTSLSGLQGGDITALVTQRLH